VEVDHKLGKLLDVDDVLGIVTLRVDDLGAASHLQGVTTTGCQTCVIITHHAMPIGLRPMSTREYCQKP